MTYELDTVYLRIKSPFVLVPEPKMKRSLSRKYHHVFAACSSYSWQERPRHSLSLFINLYPKPPKWHLGFCETYAALPLQSHSCPLSLSWLISQITISRILQPFGHISTSWNFQGLAQKSHCPWNFSSPPIKINIYHLSILIARRTTSL